ncbi:myc box-dependent-interacting protein 1b [Centroberyx gerrardi]
MAEIGKGVTAGKLAINVQKKFTRAQEKVMQKLGKADETRDAAFEETVTNFNKQMAEGTKLQRDLKAYVAAVKTMHEASRRLQDCLADMYEPEWFGKEEVDAMAEDTDMLWTDYHQKMTDDSLSSLDTYLAQFPDIKAEEELGRAQKVFEELNVELQDELPALWDSRVGLYVNTFQNLAGYQDKFHKEMGKLSLNLNDVMTKLDEQRLAKKGGTAAGKTGDAGKSEGANHSSSTDSPPKRLGPPPSRPPARMTPSPDLRRDSDLYEDEDSASDSNTASAATTPQQEQTPAAQEPQYDDDQYPQEAEGGWDDDGGSSDPQSYTQPSWDDAPTAEGQEGWNDDGAPAAQPYTEPNWDDDGAQAGQGGWGDQGNSADQSYTEPKWDDDENAVTNGSDGELPPGFVYKVKAVHDYAATDGDELELKSGDVVLVMAFDNPDEQDDGWLMGVKESQWLQKRDIAAKGVFPENFTQKV